MTIFPSLVPPQNSVQSQIPHFCTQHEREISAYLATPVCVLWYLAAMSNISEQSNPPDLWNRQAFDKFLITENPSLMFRTVSSKKGQNTAFLPLPTWVCWIITWNLSQKIPHKEACSCCCFFLKCLCDCRAPQHKYRASNAILSFSLFYSPVSFSFPVLPEEQLWVVL